MDDRETRAAVFLNEPMTVLLRRLCEKTGEPELLVLARSMVAYEWVLDRRAEGLKVVTAINHDPEADGGELGEATGGGL